MSMYRNYKFSLVGVLCLIAILVIFLSSFQKQDLVPHNIASHSSKMKGVCWVAGDSINSNNIIQLKEVGATWISQTPFGWMNGYQQPNIRMDTSHRGSGWGWGESDIGLAYTAQLAREMGVRSMLKPHIWLRNSGGKWRSDIAMKADEEWDLWFENYERFIMHYARVAERAQMESLCIGTELQTTTKKHPEKWRALIQKIRGVYSGELTYAANWYQEYEDITFWDDLDYIGIQAYFPLSKKNHPTKKDLIESWTKHKTAIEKIARKYDKQVVFTEIGYKNTADAATEPWAWPQRMGPDVLMSEATQITCYQALFESVWDEPWLDGVFIWKWFHSSYRHDNLEDLFGEMTERRNKRRERNGQEKIERRQVYFTPQFTQAKEELSKWYLESPIN